MNLTTTLIGREICKAALDGMRALLMDIAAKNRRAELSERPSKEALSTNGYLQGNFTEVPDTEEGDVEIELNTKNSAKHLRVSLIQWVASATKKDKSVHGATLVTDIAVRLEEAQRMLNQLHDQLSLPIDDIRALADISLGKEPAEPGETATPEPGNAGTGSLWDDDLVADDEPDAPARSV